MVAERGWPVGEQETIPAIVVTGPVGSGKSTTIAEMSRLLEEQAIRHAVIDMDYLRWVDPEPDGDPFGARLGYRNLAAIWPNLMDVGIRCVLIADVVESRGQIREYENAMPGASVTIVRLDVPMSELLRRLEGREGEHTIEWYVRRAPELQGIMEREGVGDVVINVGGQEAEAVASEILARTGLRSL